MLLIIIDDSLGKYVFKMYESNFGAIKLLSGSSTNVNCLVSSHCSGAPRRYNLTRLSVATGFFADIFLQ